MDGVAGSEDGHVGGEHGVVPDGDLAHVQNGQVVVGIKILAHFNVVAVVAVEGGLDPKLPARAAKQPLQDGDGLLLLLRGEVVEGIGQLPGLQPLLGQSVQPGLIGKPGQHALPVIHRQSLLCKNSAEEYSTERSK